MIYTIHVLKRELVIDDHKYKLNETEFILLYLFFHNPNKIISREEISKAMNGAKHNNITVRISKLKKKFNTLQIHTNVGQGYQLICDNINDTYTIDI
jgi:DNA-binding response OmpR family regulator